MVSMLLFRGTRRIGVRIRSMIVIGALGALVVGVSCGAHAAPQDYRFELAASPAKSGDATVVKVRLVHIPDGKAVSGAMIFRSRFDMGPDGMAEMTAPVKALPAGESSVYSFAARPSAAGNWGLTLFAKVQGEPQTVKGTVTVPVAK